MLKKIALCLLTVCLLLGGTTALALDYSISNDGTFMGVLGTIYSMPTVPSTCNQIIVYQGANIADGEYSLRVTNSGTISGGTFTNSVANMNGTITDITLEDNGYVTEAPYSNSSWVNAKILSNAQETYGGGYAPQQVYHNVTSNVASEEVLLPYPSNLLTALSGLSGGLGTLPEGQMWFYGNKVVTAEDKVPLKYTEYEAKTAYSVTTPTPGNVTVTASSDYAYEGMEVTLTQTITGTVGYGFTPILTVTDASGNPVAVDGSGKFTMPASNVTVEVKLFQSLAIEDEKVNARQYDGTTTVNVAEQVQVTFVSYAESGEVNLTLGTDYTLTGVYDKADAGTDRKATLTFTLIGDAAETYLLVSNSKIVNNCTITPKPLAVNLGDPVAVIKQEGDLSVANYYPNAELVGVLEQDADKVSLTSTPGWGSEAKLTLGLEGEAANCYQLPESEISLGLITLMNAEVVPQQTVEYSGPIGMTYTLPALPESFTRPNTDNAFRGWRDAPSASAPRMPIGSAVTVSGDVAYYATWQQVLCFFDAIYNNNSYGLRDGDTIYSCETLKASSISYSSVPGLTFTWENTTKGTTLTATTEEVNGGMESVCDLSTAEFDEGDKLKVTVRDSTNYVLGSITLIASKIDPNTLTAQVYVDGKLAYSGALYIGETIDIVTNDPRPQYSWYNFTAGTENLNAEKTYEVTADNFSVGDEVGVEASLWHRSFSVPVLFTIMPGTRPAVTVTANGTPVEENATVYPGDVLKASYGEGDYSYVWRNADTGSELSREAECTVPGDLCSAGDTIRVTVSSGSMVMNTFELTVGAGMTVKVNGETAVEGDTVYAWDVITASWNAPNVTFEWKDAGGAPLATGNSYTVDGSQLADGGLVRAIAVDAAGIGLDIFELNYAETVLTVTVNGTPLTLENMVFVKSGDVLEASCNQPNVSYTWENETQTKVLGTGTQYTVKFGDGYFRDNLTVTVKNSAQNVVAEFGTQFEVDYGVTMDGTPIAEDARVYPGSQLEITSNVKNAKYVWKNQAMEEIFTGAAYTVDAEIHGDNEILYVFILEEGGSACGSTSFNYLEKQLVVNRDDMPLMQNAEVYIGDTLTAVFRDGVGNYTYTWSAGHALCTGETYTIDWDDIADDQTLLLTVTDANGATMDTFELTYMKPALAVSCNGIGLGEGSNAFAGDALVASCNVRGVSFDWVRESDGYSLSDNEYYTVDAADFEDPSQLWARMFDPDGNLMQTFVLNYATREITGVKVTVNGEEVAENSTVYVGDEIVASCDDSEVTYVWRHAAGNVLAEGSEYIVNANDYPGSNPLRVQFVLNGSTQREFWLNVEPLITGTLTVTVNGEEIEEFDTVYAGDVLNASYSEENATFIWENADTAEQVGEGADYTVNAGSFSADETLRLICITEAGIEFSFELEFAEGERPAMTVTVNGEEIPERSTVYDGDVIKVSCNIENAEYRWFVGEGGFCIQDTHTVETDEFDDGDILTITAYDENNNLLGRFELTYSAAVAPDPIPEPTITVTVNGEEVEEGATVYSGDALVMSAVLEDESFEFFWLNITNHEALKVGSTYIVDAAECAAGDELAACIRKDGTVVKSFILNYGGAVVDGERPEITVTVDGNELDLYSPVYAGDVLKATSNIPGAEYTWRNQTTNEILATSDTYTVNAADLADGDHLEVCARGRGMSETEILTYTAAERPEWKEYTITVIGSGKDNVVSIPATALCGTKVVIHLDREDERLTYNVDVIPEGAGEAVLLFQRTSDRAYHFTMPQSNVIVLVDVDRKYEINTSTDGNGTINYWRSGVPGREIELLMIPGYGYELDTLTVTRTDTGKQLTLSDPTEYGSYFFTMPESDVDVHATFKPAESLLVWIANLNTLMAANDGGSLLIGEGYAAKANGPSEYGYIFDWYADGVLIESGVFGDFMVPDCEKIRLEVYERTSSGAKGQLVRTCNLNARGLFTGTVTVINGIGDGQYTELEYISVIANEATADNPFTGWEGTEGLAILTGNASTEVLVFQMPAHNVTLKATYANGADDSDDPITVYPVTVSGGTGSGSYEAGLSVTITANAPAEGKVFTGWTGLDGLTITSGSLTAETVTFLMPERAVEVKANYADESAETYTVTVNHGTGSGSYAVGQHVTITAYAEVEKSHFAGWTGLDGLTITSGGKLTNIVTFIMPAKAVNVTATYEQATENTVTVTYDNNATPSAQKLVTAPVGQYVLSDNSFDAPAGKQFKAWLINGAEYMPGAVISVTKDITIRAVWMDAAVAPVITQPTADQTVSVYEGEKASISVEAKNTLLYQWYVNYNDGTGWHKRGENSAAYTSAAVTPDNDGYRYKCVVTGQNGLTAESPIFTLAVLEKVEIPQTGDNAFIGLWLTLCLLSGAGMLMAARRRRAD